MLTLHDVILPDLWQVPVSRTERFLRGGTHPNPDRRTSVFTSPPTGTGPEKLVGPALNFHESEL